MVARAFPELGSVLVVMLERLGGDSRQVLAQQRHSDLWMAWDRNDGETWRRLQPLPTPLLLAGSPSQTPARRGSLSDPMPPVGRNLAERGRRNAHSLTGLRFMRSGSQGRWIGSNWRVNRISRSSGGQRESCVNAEGPTAAPEDQETSARPRQAGETTGEAGTGGAGCEQGIEQTRKTPAKTEKIRRVEPTGSLAAARQAER